MTKLLAADIGGTKTLLALAEADPTGRLHILAEHRYNSADFAGFELMIDDFLSRHGADGVERACFAVAGPIDADGVSAHVTNVGWRLDARGIGARFGLHAVRLINDFQAQAYGIDALGPDDLRVLQEGTPQARGLRTVVGAGTGLGVGQLVWQGDGYAALPSEGGHSDFAPNGALQRDLLAWLGEQHGAHVSVERVLSGPGLASIYRFLSMRYPDKADAGLERAMMEGDPAAAVSVFALASGEQTLAREALDLFVSIYGALAGSLALITLPYGGLYIAGGIAPRIIDAITGGDRFMTAFNDKGRMSRLTAGIPVSIVMNPQAGLLGALRVARAAGEGR